MKLNSATKEVTRTGLADQGSFKIKASGKAFQILSDGLYSDKVLAIVRELSTNAWDAHVAAGTETTSFAIHLPNSLEPHFSIRDFGTGLSHEDVMVLYTTYFDSTKDDSNLFVGALGLGSKSPFSYAESFTVTSFFNGEKRAYAAFVGELDEGICVRRPESQWLVHHRRNTGFERRPGVLEVQTVRRGNDDGINSACCEHLSGPGERGFGARPGKKPGVR